MLPTENSPNMMPLKMPGGAPAGNMCPIQLQLQWAKEYEVNRNKKIKYVGIGRPNAPINSTVCSTSREYWQEFKKEASEVRTALSSMGNINYAEILRIHTKENIPHHLKSWLIDEWESLGVRDQDKTQALLAEGFNKFYTLYPIAKKEEVKIKPQNILPTQGGGGGLHNFFKFIQRKHPDDYIVVQRPYYTLYTGPNKKNNLLFFDLIKTPESNSAIEAKVTLQAVLEEARDTGKKIRALVICNPNNPSGKVVSEDEWEWIIELSKEEEFYFAIDEAYVELDFSKKLFLLEFIYKKIDWIEKELSGEEQIQQQNIYKNILERLVLLRSGTKGFSGAGERMAVILAFSEKVMQELIKEDLYMGSPARATRVAYAESVNALNSRFWDNELEFLCQFYEEQVRYVEKRFKEMGVAIVDSNNNYNEVDGTFYVTGNFKALLGLEIKDKRTQEKLKEIGLAGDKLRTDVDIAYYFLVTKGIMITYLSSFGQNPTDAILRITCSEGQDFLDEVLNEIDDVLKIARGEKDRPLMPLSPVINERKHFFKNLNNHEFAVKDLSPFESEQRTNTKIFLSPHEKFADWMEQFWEHYCLKSKEVIEIRNKHINTSFDNLKNQLKALLTQAINQILEESLQLPLSNLSMESVAILENYRAALTEILREVCQYLSYHHFYIMLECLDYAPEMVYFFSRDNKQVVFDKDLSEYLDIYIRDHEKIPRRIKDKHSKIAIRNLLAELVFEKIFYNTAVDVKENEFSKLFEEFYLHQKHKINDKVELIKEIVKKRASIDYTHPQGDEEARVTMAHALNLWYKKNLITSDNILFLSINPAALLNNVFAGRIITSKEVNSWLNTNNKNISAPAALLVRNKFEQAGKIMSENELLKVFEKAKRFLEKSANHFIIIDESYIERCLDENMSLIDKSLTQILLKYTEFKERMIIIRSGMSIFSSSQDKISALITFNKEMMAKLLGESVNMHVHAPRSLQYGYANTMHDFMQVILQDDSYRKECIQYINRLCKYYLIVVLMAGERKAPTELLKHASEKFVMPFKKQQCAKALFPAYRTSKESSLKAARILSNQTYLQKSVSNELPELTPLFQEMVSQSEDPLLDKGFEKENQNNHVTPSYVGFGSPDQIRVQKSVSSELPEYEFLLEEEELLPIEDDSLLLPQRATSDSLVGTKCSLSGMNMKRQGMSNISNLTAKFQKVMDNFEKLEKKIKSSWSPTKKDLEDIPEKNLGKVQITPMQFQMKENHPDINSISYSSLLSPSIRPVSKK